MITICAGYIIFQMTNGVFVYFLRQPHFHFLASKQDHLYNKFKERLKCLSVISQQRINIAQSNSMIIL